MGGKAILLTVVKSNVDLWEIRYGKDACLSPQSIEGI